MASEIQVQKIYEKLLELEGEMPWEDAVRTVAADWLISLNTVQEIWRNGGKLGDGGTL